MGTEKMPSERAKSGTGQELGQVKWDKNRKNLGDAKVGQHDKSKGELKGSVHQRQQHPGQWHQQDHHASLAERVLRPYPDRSDQAAAQDGDDDLDGRPRQCRQRRLVRHHRPRLGPGQLANRMPVTRWRE